MTIPTVGLPQVFTLGATAALAWELPTGLDELYEVFGKRKRTTTTTTTTEHPTLPVSTK